MVCLDFRRVAPVTVISGPSTNPPSCSRQNQGMCELHNKEARPSSSNEGPKSPPSCAGRRGGMPPGRVAPNGGTRRQGGAVQIGSERAGAGPDCERADCDTNNLTSLKEARVTAKAACA